MTSSITAAITVGGPQQHPSENIQVCFRVRPFDRRERDANETSGWQIDTATNLMTRRIETVKNVKHPPQMRYPCGTLLDETTTTEQLYERQVKDIVESAMRGVNGTVFAYGQTASGKTFTMKGSGSSPGIIPLAMSQVFEHIGNCVERDFLLRVSYIEIHNECVKDLLNPTATAADLTIHESKTRGVYVNSCEKIVSTPMEVAQCMDAGERHRHYGRTEMNDLSSRSHTILRLIIESKPIKKKGEKKDVAALMNTPKKTPPKSKGKSKVLTSTLNFVDLAGSERISQTNAAVGSSLQKEGSFINKSLMFLGVIISRLSEGEKKQSLPFRESKLTRILQSSIGGNSRTSIIVTVSPSSSNVEHTVNSLRFGARAIRILNHATVNEIQSELAFISQHQMKIEGLKERLSGMSTASEEDEMNNEKENRLSLTDSESFLKRNELETQLANLQKFILNSQSILPLSELQKKRRHTFGSTKTFAAQHGSSKSTDGGDGSFRTEQIASAQSRITQLETLLADLSTENTELLQRENEHMASEEQMLQTIEGLSIQVNLYSAGEGVEVLSLEEVTEVEARLQAALKVVQREMYRKQFMQEYKIVEQSSQQKSVHEIFDPLTSSSTSSSSTSTLTEEPSFLHHLSSLMAEDNIEVKLETFREPQMNDVEGRVSMMGDEQQQDAVTLNVDDETVWSEQAIIGSEQKVQELRKKLDEMQTKLRESESTCTRLNSHLSSSTSQLEKLIDEKQCELDEQSQQMQEVLNEKERLMEEKKKMEQQADVMAKELQQVREQAYKYSKQILAQQQQTTSSEPLLVESPITPTSAVASTVTSRTSSTPTPLTDRTNLYSLASSVPAATVNVNAIPIKSIAPLPSNSSVSLVDLLQLKPITNTIPSTPIARSSSSLLNDIITRK